MPEVKIARFVDLDACRSIFSETSTFVLRSAEYYRKHYDERELIVRDRFGGEGETSCFVLSCWTMLAGDEPTRDEWGIFLDRDESGHSRERVMAIVSAPSRVHAFLERAFELEDEKTQVRQRYPFIRVADRAVTYADEVAEEIGPDNIMDLTAFTKRLRFAKEKEYRFAMPCGGVPHVIDTYIFARAPDEYMDKCFVNPQMGAGDKGQLQQIIQNATCGYGHFGDKKPYQVIANVDDLF